MLIGGRDFDEQERERLEHAEVIVVDNATIQEKGIQDALHSRLSKLVQDVDEIHLHLDLDALDPVEAPANNYQLMTEGGMRVEQLRDAITLIKKNLNITSATIASFDPTYDPQGKTLSASFELVRQITGRE
jgi:arginase